MIKRLGLLLCLALIFAACCLPAWYVTAPQEQDLALHADISFSDSERQDLQRAARMWTAVTGNRARFQIFFDLNQQDFDSLLTHYAQGHSLIQRAKLGGDMAEAIDTLTAPKGIYPLAVTRYERPGLVYVFFMEGRIAPEFFFDVAAHELGHTLRFPDLRATGSIMSGMKDQSTKPLSWVSAKDIELCKAARYCE